jgi:magnesium-transporting ATPase (P-type)
MAWRWQPDRAYCARYFGNSEAFMQNATRYLAYTFVLSYLLCVLYVWLIDKQIYQDQLHLQLSVLSLGLSYLVKFVQQPTMLAIIFATMLTGLVKLFGQLSGKVLTENLIGFIYLGYLISFGFCIYSIMQFKKQRNSSTDK